MGTIDTLTIHKQPQNDANTAIVIVGTNSRDAFEMHVTDDGIYLGEADYTRANATNRRLVATRMEMEKFARDGKDRIVIDLGDGDDYFSFRDRGARHDLSWFKNFRLFVDGGKGRDQVYLRSGWWEKAIHLLDLLNTQTATSVFASNGVFVYILRDKTQNVEVSTNANPHIYKPSFDLFPYCQIGESSGINPQTLHCK